MRRFSLIPPRSSPERTEEGREGEAHKKQFFPDRDSVQQAIIRRGFKKHIILTQVTQDRK
jgi:hypothetical protein